MGIELVPLHSDTMRRRREELSKLFKRLYEDNVLGRVTDEQYRMLAGDYTVEQKALEEQIPEKEARLEKLKAASAPLQDTVSTCVPTNITRTISGTFCLIG